MSKRYIDANKLKKEIMKLKYVPLHLEQWFSLVNSIPTEDVKPIVRGKCSIAHGMYENRICCNNCGFIKVITGEEKNYNFCPKCGAIAEREEK